MQQKGEKGGALPRAYRFPPKSALSATLDDCWFFVFHYTFAPQRWKVCKKMVLIHVLESCRRCDEKLILNTLKDIIINLFLTLQTGLQERRCIYNLFYG